MVFCPGIGGINGRMMDQVNLHAVLV